MSEIDKYKAQKQKLEGLCNEHSLTFRLNHDSYPITLSLRPLQGMYEQISLLEQAEDGKGRISQDAVLIFYKKDAEIIQQITGTFTISETLRGKFKNVFTKLCYFWEQYFFRAVMENKSLKSGTMPVIDEDEDSAPADAAEEQQEADLEEAEIGDDEPGENDTSPIDGLIADAIQLVRMENKCTVSLLQRRLKLGYSKALDVIEELEELGVVGPYRGSEPREVLPADAPDEEAAEA